MFDLRPYQREAVDCIRAYFSRGARSILLTMPTGAGKTVVFSSIASGAHAMKTRTVILVHRDTLLRQACEKLSAYGVPHGVIAPGHTPTDHNVQVASVQTLARRLPGYAFDFIVIDEAHHATAGSWRKIIDAMPGAAILGVTATPCRMDGKGLDDIFEYLIEGPGTADLIRDGFLVPPEVFAPARQLDLSRVHTRGGDYAIDELHDLMDRPTITGSAVAHYQKLCPGSSAVVFCVSVQHAEDVAKEFSAAGWRSETINGRMSADAVSAAVGRLSSRETQVLTSCDLISEGFDCPNVEAALLLRPTQSEGLYIQQVGRALRPAPGKSRAVILDHAGNCFRHGMPDDPREWSLDGRKRRHSGVGGAPIVVRQCPKCYACHRPGPVCPACMHVYAIDPREVQQISGELTEVQKLEARRVRKFRIRQCRSLDDFHALAREFGYKPGWAFLQWGMRH